MTKTRSNESKHVFKSSWWSVELPCGWAGTDDSECATFRANPPLGVLQISSARKEDEKDITDEELKEFAGKYVTPTVQLTKASYGRLSGLATQYVEEGLFFREWWLRSGHLMVYATYNVAQGGEDLERDKVETILSSLAPM